MIITYPIQIPYTAGSQQRVVPDAVYNKCEILGGSFPMGKNRFWHGGVHLNPGDRDCSTPIRAIADGELVAYRYDETDATDPFFDKVPYSRSFVLLKHEAELGETKHGISKLTFYSLYMHLQAWSEVKGKSGADAVNFVKKYVAAQARKDKHGDPLVDTHHRPIMVNAHYTTAAPNVNGACQNGSDCGRVHRGDILGYCGSIPDNQTKPSRGIHFEIIVENVDFLDNPFKTVWGRCVLTAEVKACRKLLASKTIAVDPRVALLVDQHPPSTGGFTKIHTDKQTYWVSNEQLNVTTSDEPDPKNRKQKHPVTKYFAKARELKTYHDNPSENDVTLEKGRVIVPWLDPWLDAGEFREEHYEGGTWIQVYLPVTNELVWAEKDTVHYTSDADWNNFSKQEESGAFSNDGFIDDEGLKKILDECSRGKNETGSRAAIDSKEKLRCLVTRHPTEWSKKDISRRFGRVKEDSFGAAKLTPEQFNKLIAHIERLSFWEQVPGLPQATRLWHVHPIKFIEQLARCMWLSKRELEIIYPTEHSEERETFSDGTPEETREKYRSQLNKCCYKYGINSRMRQAHFFAQAGAETRSLTAMAENATGEAYENVRKLGNIQPGDGPLFIGRGLQQFTGRYNYSKYWEFCGWIKAGEDFDVGWEHDTTKRFPKIVAPSELSEIPHLAVDSGCWYTTLFRGKTAKAMDADDISAVTAFINGGSVGGDKRSMYTKRLKAYFL